MAVERTSTEPDLLWRCTGKPFQTDNDNFPERNSPIQFRSMLPILCWLLLFFPGRNAGSAVDGANPAASSAADNITHIYMHNVLFHVMDSVVLKVDTLEGIMEPSKSGQIVSLDDKGSFVLELQNAKTSISASDLTALVNGFILPRADTPLSNLSLTFNPDQSIFVKGIFHKLVDVPFTSKATMQATPDGNMKMHLSDMRVAGVIDQDVLDFLGLRISELAQPKRKQSFQIVGNDIIFPIDEMFPPPRISGMLQSVSISGGRLNVVFGVNRADVAQKKSAQGGEPPIPPISSRNYIYFRGGVMQFGRLTMSPVDLELVNLKHANSFEFSLERYYEQLVAGYSKSLPSKGLIVYMADYGDITKSPHK